MQMAKHGLEIDPQIAYGVRNYEGSKIIAKKRITCKCTPTFAGAMQMFMTDYAFILVLILTKKKLYEDPYQLS